MRHDGGRGRAGALGAWVVKDSCATACVEPGEKLLIEMPDATDAVWVGPGQYLVRERRGQVTWRVYEPEDFESFFDATVRELPVFPDGEAA